MYQTIYREKNQEVEERYVLCLGRIREIPAEAEDGEVDRFFCAAADFVAMTAEVLSKEESGELGSDSLSECRSLNRRLYEGLQGERYEKSFANPDYAARVLPEEVSAICCFLASELYALIPLAFEGRKYDMTILLELFIELYGIYQEAKREGEGFGAGEMRETIAAFFRDYSEVFAEEEIRAKVDPELDFFTQIVMESDLGDFRYLYRYGACIGENEEKIAAFLSSLKEEEIRAMARTFAEGYRKGFVMTGKDLSKKRYVTVEYPIGFERMVREAIREFQEMGLRPVIFREAVCSFQGLGKTQRGCYSKSLNPQYAFDHKNDRAFYQSKAFHLRRMESMQNAFETYKEKANAQGGPAVIESFGEPDFKPIIKAAASSFTEEQTALNLRYMSEAGELTNRYIIGEERSFTVIAYPLPSIGERFEEIFAETVKINTLDNARYQEMQQAIIDVLDQGERVRVRGTGGSETDITVSLHPLVDPEKETNFENCTADVNIPVGEVFTSPVLKGTNGVLHVSRVYLNGLSYENLRLTFRDGMVTDYTCSNFESEEENRRYIYENILMQHDTLPLGEFAIGTNTTAYRMMRDFKIEKKMPILIAEKTGPHFAVGDTCYSYEEDLRTYNPDGKAIIARDNEVSILRKTDPSKAYMNCHTDITVPYEELGSITVISSDGTETDIIRDGRFVVPGTEELNQPLM